MNQIVAEFIVNPTLSLSASDKLILLTVADHIAGMRIEEIAAVTGSRFRWIARQVSKLTQMGILRRVAPGTYALSERNESKP